jgi:hypothetical protein
MMRLFLMLCVLLLGPATEALVQRAMTIARAVVAAEIAALPGPQRAALGDLTALVECWSRGDFSALPPTDRARTPAR